MLRDACDGVFCGVRNRQKEEFAFDYTMNSITELISIILRSIIGLKDFPRQVSNKSSITNRSRATSHGKEKKIFSSMKNNVRIEKRVTSHKNDSKVTPILVQFVAE